MEREIGVATFTGEWRRARAAGGHGGGGEQWCVWVTVVSVAAAVLPVTSAKP